MSATALPGKTYPCVACAGPHQRATSRLTGDPGADSVAKSEAMSLFTYANARCGISPQNLWQNAHLPPQTRSNNTLVAQRQFQQHLGNSASYVVPGHVQTGLPQKVPGMHLQEAGGLE